MIFTKEHREKLSRAKKKLYREGKLLTCFKKGHKHSPEVVKKILSHPNHPLFKKRNQYGSFENGEKNPRWNGGKYKQSQGYILILKPNHLYTDNKGYVFEHRLIMEKALDRYMKPEERIHHINGIKTDNRIENLMLFANDSEHTKHHHKLTIT